MLRYYLGAARRAAPAITLAATLLGSALMPPAPAGAFVDTSDRLQVFVKEVHIHDDREGAFSGAGEMELGVRIFYCSVSYPSPCNGGVLRASHRFSASTDETVTINRLVPQSDDELLLFAEEISPEIGFPLDADHHYHVRFDMNELDGLSNDEFTGHVTHVLESGKIQQGLGTYTARSLVSAARVGDFTIVYEIRRAPLPDLRPVYIKVGDLPGSAKKRVCTDVQNIGSLNAGQFEVALRVDGDVPPGGRVIAAGLAPGAASNSCVDVDLPAGYHVLAATVDGLGDLTELVETNNVFELAHTVTLQQASNATQPEPSSTAAQADLTISAIRVNGRAPDGKDDCKDGKNTVAVVVKNAGTEKAGPFAVRLDLNGGQVAEEPVDGLEAGKVREVKFDDVRLKKGQQRLTATLDPKNTVDESGEENNERQITVRCQDDN